MVKIKMKSKIKDSEKEVSRRWSSVYGSTASTVKKSSASSEKSLKNKQKIKDKVRKEDWLKLIVDTVKLPTDNLITLGTLLDRMCKKERQQTKKQNEKKIKELEDEIEKLNYQTEQRIVHYNQEIKQLKKQIEELPENVIGKIKKSSRLVNENDLQNMKFIELSYTGELIPVEEVERILDESLIQEKEVKDSEKDDIAEVGRVTDNTMGVSTPSEKSKKIKRGDVIDDLPKL